MGTDKEHMTLKKQYVCHFWKGLMTFVGVSVFIILLLPFCWESSGRLRIQMIKNDLSISNSADSARENKALVWNEVSVQEIEEK